MGRFAVVLPLDPLAPGDAFPVSAWPLHVTVLEPFETTHDAAWVVDLIGPVLRGRRRIEAEATERARFGRRRDIPVTLLAEHAPLAAMRTRLLDALRTADVDVARARLDYRPHVTDTVHGAVAPGAQVRLEQAALVDLRPPQGRSMRAVVAVWPLD